MVAFLSVLCLSFLFVTKVNAASLKVKTISYSGEDYTVTERLNGDVTVINKNNGSSVKYSKSKGVLTIGDTATGKVTRIDLGGINSISLKASNSNKNNEYAYSNSLKTYNGKKYMFWQIQIPNQIKFTYEINNSSSLYNFQTSVDQMREYEDKLAWDVGTSMASILIAVILASPAGAVTGAVLALIGELFDGPSLIELLNYSNNVKECQENCTYYFNKVVVVSIPY